MSKSPNTTALKPNDFSSFDVFNTENTIKNINDQQEPNIHKKTSRQIVKEKKQVSKRSQVKNACVNCQKACKKCDDGRACQRCVKFGIVDTCVDSPRKQRKKGFKRGPYKKREKQTTENTLSSSDLNSQNMDFCMQPVDPTNMSSFQIKNEDNDLNFMLPNHTPTQYLVENTNTLSSTSSPNSAPHINADDDFMPLYDNTLFALPKTENNIFISVTHPVNDLNDAFNYNDISFDMTHASGVNNNQWIKNNILDNQDFITGI